MTTGVKRALLGPAGEQTLARRVGSPVREHMLLSSFSVLVMQGLQEELITSVRSVDIVGRNR